MSCCLNPSLVLDTVTSLCASVCVEQKAHAITRKEFADRIRKKITDDQTHDAQYYSVTPEVDTQGTSHVSVLDEDGMAVSVTSSINYL